jgi:protein with PEP-CTERM/exosortase system signal
MKSLKYLLAVLALTGALAISAKADLQFLGAIDFGNGPNDPDTNRQAFIDTFGFDPGTLNHNYQTPPDGSTDFSQPVDVFPGEFFVVHYGKGKGGTGDGGSWEFFQVINGETSVAFPQFGNGPDNPDPYGHGGISSARGFGGGENTPDSGTTAALLGLGLTGLAGLRGRFGRK